MYWFDQLCTNNSYNGNSVLEKSLTFIGLWSQEIEILISININMLLRIKIIIQ